ncbi:MAG: tetratricopeptide repeat protein, partial [Acidobacteriota bacterium]|nr:tetratricopeptide repeat protein [Acidobacteriota bacterium]MDQ5872537.1 tetratricopeptide repeat protein [Acidobacteriota bacterium]
LHDRAETDPKGVSIASKAIHRLLESVGPEIAPDLRLFLLAEAAKLAGGALRSVGNNSEVEEWLDKAEKHFRAGVNPRPGLAQVLYLRLIGMYTLGDPEVVVRASPQLEATFTELGMEEDRVKCRILWASSLKVASRLQEALDVLEPVREWRSRIRPSLYAWVLLQSGDIHQNLASYDRALEEFGEAARLFREGRQYIGLADLNSMMSCIYRAQGRLDEALHLLQTSRQDHARLEMTWAEGYHRMLIAETYLAMGRPREAEIEIRAALPILEEQGMLADAVIAVNLLREAVRQRKLDPADTRGSFKPKK